jgi:hypothetical protein
MEFKVRYEHAGAGEVCAPVGEFVFVLRARVLEVSCGKNRVNLSVAVYFMTVWLNGGPAFSRGPAP